MYEYHPRLKIADFLFWKVFMQKSIFIFYLKFIKKNISLPIEFLCVKQLK